MMEQVQGVEKKQCDVLVIGGGLGAWFVTQRLIGSRSQPAFTGGLGRSRGPGRRDAGHRGRRHRFCLIGIRVEMPDRGIPAKQQHPGQENGQDHIALVIHDGVPKLASRSMV